jgi:hypothetical protein
VWLGKDRPDCGTSITKTDDERRHGEDPPLSAHYLAIRLLHIGCVAFCRALFTGRGLMRSTFGRT